MVAIEVDTVGEYREIPIQLDEAAKRLSRASQRKLAQQLAILTMAEEGYRPFRKGLPHARLAQDGSWLVVGRWTFTRYRSDLT